MSESDLEHLALLLRLAAMTGREIASVRSADKAEILELIDQAEDVGRRLEEIARRQIGDPSGSELLFHVPSDKKH